MYRTYFTSDLHFCHDREFLYKPRRFDSIDKMNNAIVERWNSIVDNDDEVYVLGDIMLNDNEKGIGLLKKLNGKIHIIIGNHDTNTRINLYNDCENVVDIRDACYFKFGKYNFFLTHFPCITGNLEQESLTQATLNLYGHTHQKTNFYEDRPYMYHVGVDSHDCYPVYIEDIIQEMNSKVYECKKML